ncbi:MAG: hypothetical protein RBU21_09045 [FCB group bacterium]|jgi:hypothetical protein|nr:hypothetical protein [FCB group bacterium]
MRLILAGLFVICGLLVIPLVIAVLENSGPIPAYGRAMLYMSVLVYVPLLIFGAFFLFNRRGTTRAMYMTPEEYERYLVGNGLLVEERYTAARAFNVEEFGDEGSIYFVELTDGRVLFLMGQYLYEYEPIDDGPDNRQPRTFPCTEFTLRRHRDEGYVYDIKCGGEILEPEVTAAWLGKDVWKKGVVPGDAEIIAGRTYDDLKQEHMGRKR